MDRDATSDGANELHRLALTKMERVLGRERARHLLTRILEERRMELRTNADLLRLSEALTALGGIEGAVGAMLGVTAVLRGGVSKT